MPRYYLHIRNGTGFVADPEGTVVPSLEEARLRAIEGARSLLSAELCTGELDLRGRIEIADERNHVVLVVPFHNAVRILTGELSPETAGANE